eukprot:gene39542-48140_t
MSSLATLIRRVSHTNVTVTVAAFATQTKKRMIRGRFEVVPKDLYRFSDMKKTIRLRDSKSRAAKGLMSYDIKIHEDNLVHPAPLDNTFIGPNGASLRPAGVNMCDLITERGPKSLILELKKGLVIPKGLVLLHEFGDHFSLQCAVPMPFDELEERMNIFAKSCDLLTAQEYELKNPVENLMETFTDE